MDIATLETLPKEAQELAITSMLDQSRQWLDRALEATNPTREVAEFKAFIATVAEAARQKKLSEGIQLDALEMVRRSERALGVAIRKGQEAGELRRDGQHGAGLDATSLSPTRHAHVFNIANGFKFLEPPKGDAMSDDWKDNLAGALATLTLAAVLISSGALIIYLARSTPWL